MEEEKKETKTTETTETTETVNNTETTKTETKKGNTVLCAVIAIVVIAAIVAGVYFLVVNKSGNPEEVAKKYVEAMNEGSADKIIEITDAKAALAWKNCDGDIEKFEEELNKVNDEDANSYKDELKNSLDQAMAMLKAFGGVTLELNNVEKPVDMGKGIYKVTANVKMAVFGQEQEQDINLATYNGKYIGEMASTDEETEIDTDTVEE